MPPVKQHGRKSQEVALVEKVHFGEKMQALTVRERLWVMLWNSGGHHNAADCARRAGYSDVGGAAKVQGHHLLHNPKIREAIVEDIANRLAGKLARAVAIVEEISETPGNKDRLAAAKWIASQGGLIEKTRTELEVTVRTESYAEKVQKLRQLATNAGQDPDAVLRSMGIDPDAPIIDVEAVDVAEAPPEPEPIEW